MHLRKFSVSALCALCAVAITQPAHAGQFDHTDTSTSGLWTAPAGAETVQVILSGAAGGAGASISGGIGGSGGGGAIVSSSINVTAGTILDIELGNAGTNASGTGASAGGASGITPSGGDGGSDPGGAGGGGGGGASVVRIGGADVLIAGGGGGGGGANGDVAGGATLVANPTGGAGGSAGAGYVILNGSTDLTGSPGTAGSNSTTSGGGGATGSAGGSAGTFGSAGAANVGGTGGSNLCAGGGGGGGYYGGGGGGAAASFNSTGCSGGGGGSSYMNPTWTGTNRIYSDGSNTGAGAAQVNYIDFTTTSLTSGEVGSSYSQNVIATFGAATSPDVWSVSPALPAGLTLNASTGAITGTPTEAVNSTYTVTASYNPGGIGLIARSSTTLTLLIAAAPEPESATAVNAVNGAYVVAPNISSRGGPWNVRVGDPTILIPTVNSGSAARYLISPALPQGLSLNEFTGVISGVAQSVSPQVAYTLTATNPGGSSSASFTIGVVGELSSASNDSSGSSESAANAVRFSAGTYALDRAARRSLDQLISTQEQRASHSLVITSVIPRSASSSAQQAAYRRGVTVRKYLRSRGLDVSSQIKLREAADPGELRQVAIG